MVGQLGGCSSSGVPIKSEEVPVYIREREVGLIHYRIVITIYYIRLFQSLWGSSGSGIK